jgi:predicted small lipoprotein YifL
MRRSILLLPLCFTVAVIAGCGNKGPLYLPPKPALKPAPAPAAPAPAHISTAAEPAHASSINVPAAASSSAKPAGGP